MNDKPSSFFYVLGRLYAKNPKTFLSIIISALAVVGYFGYGDYQDGQRYKRNAADYDNRMFYGVTPYDKNRPANQQQFERILNPTLENLRDIGFFGKVTNELVFDQAFDNFVDAVCQAAPYVEAPNKWIGILTRIEKGANTSARVFIRTSLNIVITNEGVLDDTESNSENYKRLLNASIGDVLIFDGEFVKTEYKKVIRSSPDGQLGCRSAASDVRDPYDIKGRAERREGNPIAFRLKLKNVEVISRSKDLQ